MSVLQNFENNQDAPSRQVRKNQQRQLEKQLKQLQKITKQKAAPVTFDNLTVTQFGLFGFLEAFKQVIGFSSIVEKNLAVNRRHNATYSAPELLETLLDSVCLGQFRFSHLEKLQKDQGYRQIKQAGKIADESTIRYFMNQFTEDTVKQLMTINRELLACKFASEPPREVWVDFDDTVITVFGEQENAAVGYNPRYHGRPSFKAKVAFIAGTGELVHCDLYDGKTASNGHFLDFLKATLESFDPRRIIVKGIRVDRGFFDEKLFDYLDSQSIEYVCKARMTANVSKIAEYLEREQEFTSISSNYSTAEIRVPLPKWEKSRRFVIIRETLKPKEVKGQGCLDLTTYEYQGIVTSTDEGTAEDIWHDYNQRARIENKIDELKVGFGVDQMSQHDFISNQAYLLIKSLSYNLLNWFRLALLTEEDSHFEVSTIRRKILNVPGNLVGSDAYRHLKLAPDKELEVRVTHMEKQLQTFLVWYTTTMEAWSPELAA